MNTIKYLKRYWEENRGDNFDYWRTSNWYFETDSTGDVQRQIEEYEIGIRLRYANDKIEDRFGGLSKVKLDLTDGEYIIIGQEEFNNKWHQRNYTLCQTIDSDTMTVDELGKIEINLPISDKLHEELFSTGLINKLQHLPMKYGPIQDFEEAMILKEGLKEMLKILRESKLKFSKDIQNELEHVIEFIKEGELNKKAIQLWF